MKTAICAIAKHENVYINDWVNYHLNLGFDHIYIYDDNSSSGIRETLNELTRFKNIIKYIKKLYRRRSKKIK